MVLVVNWLSNRMDIIPIDDASRIFPIVSGILFESSKYLCSIDLCDKSGIIIKNIWRCVYGRS